MSTVKFVSTHTHQPRGGYLPLRSFTRQEFNDGIELSEETQEDVKLASAIGTAVDALARVQMGWQPESAFRASFDGALVLDRREMVPSAGKIRCTRAREKAQELLAKIVGLDEASVLSAVRLCCFDAFFRAGIRGSADEVLAMIESTTPSTAAIRNASVMVQRTVELLRSDGLEVNCGLDLTGSYTKNIMAGDCDYVTERTLWDVKVLRKGFTSAHTLQLLIYYIMGRYSVHPEFGEVERIGLFNPRTNTAYVIPVANIPTETLQAVSWDVIGYPNDRW